MSIVRSAGVSHWVWGGSVVLFRSQYIILFLRTSVWMTLNLNDFQLGVFLYLLLLTSIFILYIIIQIMFITHLIRVSLEDIPKIRNMSTLPLGVGVEYGVV